MSATGAVAPGYGTEAATPHERARGSIATPVRPPSPGRPLEPGGPGPRQPLRPSPPGGPPSRPPKRKRSTGERILRWALVTVAVIVALAAAAYGYIRYRWGQVHTLACATCQSVAAGQPFNVLLVGSDTRAGESASAAQHFGSSSQVTGQRSDTIKILHVDPSSGTARLLSIPRDTFVTLSDVPASSGLGHEQKINAAFDAGPEPLIATIQNTLGIPISHFVIVDFQGLTNAVDALGGIWLNFPYPVRDNDAGNNNSGLLITHTGCQRLNGTMTLALARSRFYQYDENGYWHYDPTSDIGRIERQNIVIQAIASRARGSYNPITLNSFLGSVVHDVTVDKGMGFGLMLSLATTYHAFSPGHLQSFTLPTVGGSSSFAGSVQVVNQPVAEQVLMQFLGTAPNYPSTPPLSSSGNPITPPAATTTTTAPTSSTGSGSKSAPTAQSPSASATSFDPTVCSG